MTPLSEKNIHVSVLKYFTTCTTFRTKKILHKKKIEISSLPVIFFSSGIALSLFNNFQCQTSCIGWSKERNLANTGRNVWKGKKALFMCFFFKLGERKYLNVKVG